MVNGKPIKKIPYFTIPCFTAVFLVKQSIILPHASSTTHKALSLSLLSCSRCRFRSHSRSSLSLLCKLSSVMLSLLSLSHSVSLSSLTILMRRLFFLRDQLLDLPQKPSNTPDPMKSICDQGSDLSNSIIFDLAHQVNSLLPLSYDFAKVQYWVIFGRCSEVCS